MYYTIYIEGKVEVPSNHNGSSEPVDNTIAHLVRNVKEVFTMSDQNNENKEKIKMKVPRLETIKKTAELLNLPEYFVRQKVNCGEVVAITAGRKKLVNVDKFIEYLNSATVKPANEPTANVLGIMPITRH